MHRFSHPWHPYKIVNNTQVMVAVHFFIVAYNTDLVEQHEGDGTAWIAEVILAGKTTWPLLSSYFPVI